MITSHALFSTKDSAEGTLLQRLRDKGVVESADLQTARGIRHYDNILNLKKTGLPEVSEYLQKVNQKFEEKHGSPPEEEDEQKALMIPICAIGGRDGVVYSLNHNRNDFPATVIAKLFPEEVFVYRETTEMDLDELCYLNQNGPCNQEGVPIGSVLCTVPESCFEKQEDGSVLVTLKSKKEGEDDLSFAVRPEAIVDANIGGLRKAAEGTFEVSAEPSVSIGTPMDVNVGGKEKSMTPKEILENYCTTASDYFREQEEDMGR